MKKLAAILFITALLAINAFGQSDPPPTLKIVTESPGLPSELFYGNIKVKPLRLRPGTNTPITINDHDFFIQQQYVDFLRRFPEAGPDGVYGTADDPLQFYLNIINGCNSSDVECLKYTRGALAANFFRSPEFQQKGSFVMYLYMVSLGQRAATVAELSNSSKIDRPHYPEFMADLQSISDPNDDKAIVNAKKDALTVAWLQRAEVNAIYGALSNAAFVQKLVDTAGVTFPSSYQNGLVTSLNNSTMTRAQVLRAIVESSEVNAKFYKPAFVTMQYFGFLRRDPEPCTAGMANPEGCGYIFHNNRFNLPADQAFLENTMVRGFTESPEYFNRF